MVDVQAVSASGSLGEYAYQAIQKHFKKSIKHETEVLADQDPEPLHQMRVGMRRLRTVLQVFGTALDLPSAGSSRQIQRIARSLGEVRDLDVLKTEFEEQYLPNLQGDEQQRLKKVLNQLQQSRLKTFGKLEKTLQGSRYKAFKHAFGEWLEQPRYGAIAQFPMLPVLPDLLLPLISDLLLHPGWLVGVEVQNDQVHLLDRSNPEAQAHLEAQSEQLHDLRKQMKRVRYQAEFFVEFYSDNYQKRLKEFQAIQEVLGRLQDLSVLKEFLTATANANWPQKMPTLAQQIQQERAIAWENWQTFQVQYLDWQFRKQLRQIILHPLAATTIPADDKPPSPHTPSTPA